MNRMRVGAGLALLLAGSCVSATMGPGNKRVSAGTWGGQGIALTVTEAGAHVEFPCAHGDVSEPLTVDGNGNLAVDGVFVQERPGPVRIGEEPEKKPARYTGKVDGNTMTLDVILKDSNQSVGSYSLTHGATPRVTKCR
jgi:hypothetical protein